MNGSLMDSTLTEQEWYNRLLWDYMSLIAKKGVMVEVNTKAYTKKGMMFPNVKYFKWLKELNIPVMVNSDAHLPQLVNDNRALAFRVVAGSRNKKHDALASRCVGRSTNR